MKEKMKKLFVLLSVVLLSACTQLMSGQMQPVKTLDYKNSKYFTTCGGAVEDWGSCKDKARQTCPNGYAVIDRVESAVGGRREFTFQCIK
jgi:hypothetical protein